MASLPSTCPIRPIRPDRVWTEDQLASQGLPAAWVLCLHAQVDFPFAGPCSNGVFNTHRILRPRPPEAQRL